MITRKHRLFQFCRALKRERASSRALVLASELLAMTPAWTRSPEAMPRNRCEQWQPLQNTEMRLQLRTLLLLRRPSLASPAPLGGQPGLAASQHRIGPESAHHQRGWAEPCDLQEPRVAVRRRPWHRGRQHAAHRGPRLRHLVHRRRPAGHDARRQTGAIRERGRVLGRGP